MKRQRINGAVLCLFGLGLLPIAMIAQIEVGKNNNVGIRMPEQSKVTLSLDNREGDRSKNLTNIECKANHVHHSIYHRRDTLYNIKLRSMSNVKLGASYLFNISGRLVDTAGKNTSSHVRKYRVGIDNRVRILGPNESYPNIITSNSVIRYYGIRNWLRFTGNPNIVQHRQEVYGMTNYLHTYQSRPKIAIGYYNLVRRTAPYAPQSHYGIYNKLETRVSYDTVPGTSPVALYSEIQSGGGEFGGRRYAGYFVGDVLRYPQCVEHHPKSPSGELFLHR